MAARCPRAPLRDPENALGRAYANSLRDKARALRTSYVLSMHVRKLIADDLDALAVIAETRPEVFDVGLANALARKGD